MAMTSDTSPPGRVGRVGRVVGLVLALVVGLALAGALGWRLAGPPWSGAAVVPPGCPPEPAASGGQPGDRLVPMPLPEPRGPVSVRVCGYERRADGRYTPWRQVVVEPVRTAALAALVDEHPGAVAPGTRPPATCRPADRVAVLVFRYTAGPAVHVRVDGGTCGLVSTATRVETGRQDVVRRVEEILAAG